MNKINTNHYGFQQYINNTQHKQEDNNQILSRITSVHGQLYEIINENGVGLARIKTSLIKEMDLSHNFPGVGDYVLIEYNQDHNIIVKVLPRYTQLVRSKPRTGFMQTIAANIDYVFIITSMNKEFNPSRVSRYLSAVYDSGAIPVIVLTKADLAINELEYIVALDEVAFGVDVVTTSAYTEQGIEELNKYLVEGNTVVFVGSSGIGKSSLINILCGKEVMKVKEIREDDARGRHTTTHRQIILLPTNALVIDTPGMREFSLYGNGKGVDSEFSDIIELFKMCKYGDCRHDKEPGCAVKEAIADNIITQKRFDQYKKLQRVKKYEKKNVNKQPKSRNIKRDMLRDIKTYID